MRLEAIKERNARVIRDLERALQEIKDSDPEKYQELIDAENQMYRSWLEHRQKCGILFTT